MGIKEAGRWGGEEWVVMGALIVLLLANWAAGTGKIDSGIVLACDIFVAFAVFA